MAASRYVVGIDLGTTNSALAYVDTKAAEGDAQRPAVLPVPQVVQPGVVEDRTLLPSFLYLPLPGEVPAGSLRLPWAAERDYSVGEYARKVGTQVETRLVTSAKSWRSEEHTSELQSLRHLVCRLLLEKKNTQKHNNHN